MSVWRLLRPSLCASAVGAVALWLAASPVALAQSFNCAKASTPVEQAICASTDLRAADEALARAYGAALAIADAEAAPGLRASQRIWTAERNACVGANSGAIAGATAADCLAKAYKARTNALAALAAAGPSLPPGPPAGSASLSKTSVPAAGEHDALLTVASPGRFAIRATSKTGVALQLVDMIVGPGDIAGDPGVRDGRLDVLLDRGVYKLRLSGAKIANGDATLSVTPFAPLGPADTGLLRAGETSGALADLQQRSFWLFVDSRKRLSVDAAGRSLRDLRAWRNGTDLVDIAPDAASVEPKAGRPLARLRLDGVAEPGLYLVIAYGGEALPWSDGDTAQPLYIQAGAPPFLSTGSAEAVIGPSGILRYLLPQSANHARIELPEAAPARLTIRNGKDVLASAAIAKDNREPVAAASFSAGDAVVAEITGLAGQHVRLRALATGSSARAERIGTYAAGVDVAGDGGDEIPSTAVLARFDKTSGKANAQVVASTALRTAPGQAWRRKLNVRGPSTLIVEAAASGSVAARTQGVGVRLTLEPLLGVNAPRADGKKPRQWDVEAGFYMLKIDPVAGAVGVLDLTFGQPDLAVDVSPPVPSRGTIDFGLVTVDRLTIYQLLLNSAPGFVTAPRLRALPADLAAGALTVMQGAKPATPQVTPQIAPPAVAPPAPIPPPKPRAEGTPPKPAQQKPIAAGQTAVKPPAPAPKPAAPKPVPPKPAPVLPAPSLAGDKALTLPVKTPAGGTISVTDASGRAVPFTKTADVVEKNIRSTTIGVAPSDTQRQLTVAWTPARANEPLPALPREGAEPRIAAGTPLFFDLGKDDRKSFALDVADGGLYRVETLGRLKTMASIGTRFLPKIDEAEDNGPGHNALIQTWLRGGAYRVAVSAQDSEGRAGLVARPARLIDGGVIPADGSARATLADGAGAAFALDIAETGDYRLDLYSLDQTFMARLEDAEGWPLAAPGELSTLTRRFEKGRYRLVVMPPDVDAQVVVRLRRLEETKPPEGHGPHALPFDAVTSAQWREPASKDAPRTPDRWEFTLAGAAKITLTPSDGMTGDLLGPDGKSLARVAKDRPFSGELPPGRYTVEMRALGRDDRLDYTLDLRSEALQPGSPRFVDLPATLPFAIAQDSIVGLTTFGEEQLTAVLRNEAGDAIERLSGRTDDWNIALSRRLPAGRYSLELASLKTPGQSSDDDSDKSDKNDNADDPPRAQAAAAEDAQNGDEEKTSQNADDRSKVEVRLALPDERPAQPLALSGVTQIPDGGAARLTLPTLDAGALLLVAAQADAEIVLSLERREASGRTTVAGFSRGRTPVIAVPIGAKTRDGWELAVWSIDGGKAATTLAARTMTMPAQSGDSVSLTAAGSEAPLNGWRVGHAATPGKTIVGLTGRTPGLRTGSTSGRPLTETETGLLAPQADSIWLVAPAGADAVALSPQGDTHELALTLGEGDIATLPTAQQSGRLRIWRADATDGQPGFVAASGAGIANGSAFALGDGAVGVWNAGSSSPLALRVTARDVARLSSADAGEAKAVAIPLASAQPLRLPSGNKRIALELAPGVAAILSGGDATRTIWASDVARSTELIGIWSDVLLVNTTDTPAPAKVTSVPTAAVPPLNAGRALKQFFGASGSLAVTIDGKPGDHLTVAGGDGTFVGADGRVARGAALALSGPGVLTIDHPPGLVVTGVENGDATPWAAPKATAVKLPASLPLAGASMALGFHTDAPTLLRIRTTAPVVMALRQAGSGDPEPMPLGADVRRYVAAGDVELRLFSAHDGPLSGTLDLSAEPVTPIGDGIGEAQIVPPAGRASFAFEVERAGMVGVGVRAEPDRVAVRLLDAKGVVLGDGVAQLRKLDKGRYVLEAAAPADGPTVTVRPAVIGLKPRPGGPPPDVAAKYLELVGMKAKR